MVSYESATLKFKRSVIESLRYDEEFEIITPYCTFRMTRKEFEETFYNVIETSSYRRGEYHYPAGQFPEKAFQFKVNKRSVIQ